MLATMLVTALLAVGAENLFFAGGMGFSRVLRAARRPADMGIYALFVTFFSFASVFTGMWLDPALPYGAKNLPQRVAAYALATALIYLLTVYLLRSFLPSFYKRYSQIPAPAAVNTVVMALPLLRRDYNMDVATSAGFALGTGVAFYLAAVVMAHAMERCKNKDMPKAFSGLPASLLYVGILSMAIAGLTGGKVF